MDLFSWLRDAPDGAEVSYGPTEAYDAYCLCQAGKVALFQRRKPVGTGGATFCLPTARKISPRAKRFLDWASALTPAPNKARVIRRFVEIEKADVEAMPYLPPPSTKVQGL